MIWLIWGFLLTLNPKPSTSRNPKPKPKPSSQQGLGLGLRGSGSSLFGMQIAETYIGVSVQSWQYPYTSHSHSSISSEALFYLLKYILGTKATIGQVASGPYV